MKILGVFLESWRLMVRITFTLHYIDVDDNVTK